MIQVQIAGFSQVESGSPEARALELIQAELNGGKRFDDLPDAPVVSSHELGGSVMIRLVSPSAVYLPEISPADRRPVYNELAARLRLPMAQIDGLDDVGLADELDRQLYARFALLRTAVVEGRIVQINRRSRKTRVAA